MFNLIDFCGRSFFVCFCLFVSGLLFLNKCRRRLTLVERYVFHLSFFQKDHHNIPDMKCLTFKVSFTAAKIASVTCISYAKYREGTCTTAKVSTSLGYGRRSVLMEHILAKYTFAFRKRSVFCNSYMISFLAYLK